MQEESNEVVIRMKPENICGAINTWPCCNVLRHLLLPQQCATRQSSHGSAGAGHLTAASTLINEPNKNIKSLDIKHMTNLATRLTAKGSWFIEPCSFHLILLTIPREVLHSYSS